MGEGFLLYRGRLPPRPIKTLRAAKISHRAHSRREKEQDPVSLSVVDLKIFHLDPPW